MFELDASPWDLPVVGFVVTEVSFFGLPQGLFAGQPARGLFIIAYNDKSGWTLRDFPKPVPNMKLRLSGPFLLESAGVRRSLDTDESWESLVPLLTLRGKRVAAAQADRQGFLRIEFDDGSTLSVAPDPDAESWEMTGPGFDLECPQDGGDPRMSIFDPEE